MTEVVSFRLLLVALALLLLSFGGVGIFAWQQGRLADVAVTSSFDEYNRFLDACDGRVPSELDDLARRSYDALERASRRRDHYASLLERTIWSASVAIPAVVALYYALRWAFTGRVRPWWVLSRANAGGSRLREPD